MVAEVSRGANGLGATEVFGIHLMIDGYQADPALLNDEVHFTSVLSSLPGKLGMHKITEPVVVKVGPNNKKDPGGISGFVMIAESHISFHSFPNRQFISIDVYTCQSDLVVDDVARQIIGAFAILDSDIIVVERGKRYPSADLHGRGAVQVAT